MRTPARRTSLPGLALLALTISTVLVSLGLWQLQRREAKERLIADFAARATAAPAPLPDPSQWPRLRPETYEYRHVALEGRFENDKEVLVFRAAGTGRGGAKEPGYHVLTPLALESGGYVVVNRGFIPQSLLDRGLGPETRIEGRVSLTGLMRSPEARNLFTPRDDPADRLYFTRDPAAIAAQFGLWPSAPFSIDAVAAPGSGAWPKAGTTELIVPNNHLSYALTWFGLAATAAAVFGALALQKRRPVH